jgi:hypothetical protein
MKKWKPNPAWIDYPDDRTLLKKEFAKIASTPGFAESVAKAEEVLGKDESPSYDSLANFLKLLSNKIAEDANKNASRKLTKVLLNASDLIATAAEHIQVAWQISEPHMGKK